MERHLIHHLNFVFHYADGFLKKERSPKMDYEQLKTPTMHLPHEKMLSGGNPVEPVGFRILSELVQIQNRLFCY